MDRDDFDLAVVSGNTRIEGDKWNSRAAAQAESPGDSERLALLIFRDPPLDSDSSGSGDVEPGWYAIANTEYLAVGSMKVIATAHIPDGNADDLIRKDIDVANLGRLVNP